MLKRSAQQRFVAWLALAAMALIVLMPVISRSMPMDDAMMMGMSGHAQQVGHAHHHSPGMPGHPDDPTAHCGYCVLFSHMPVVGFGAPAMLPPVQLASFAPHAVLPRNVPAALLLSAQPRGPPFANG